MNAVVYLFQVSACMGIFYLFYYLLLSRFTFFTINRWYLISTLAICFIIPLLTITVQQPESYPQVIQKVVYVNSVQNFSPIAVAADLPAGASKSISWVAVLKLLYVVSVAALLLRLMLMVIRFFTSVKSKKSTKINGVHIVQGDDKLINGSFFNFIFLNDDELSADELEQIIAHEMLHVKLYHSVDRMLIKIAQVFLWFNPFVYLYARAIEENHEFEVDRAVSNSTDRNKYAELLFHLSVARQGTLYHSFSMVPLKKRITMLFTKPTNRMKKVIYLLVVPVVLISCLAFAKLKSEEKRFDRKNDPVLANDGKFKDSVTKKAFFSRLRMKKNDGKYYDKATIQRASGSMASDDIAIDAKIGFIINNKLYNEKDFRRLFPIDKAEYGKTITVAPKKAFHYLAKNKFKLSDYDLIFDFRPIDPTIFGIEPTKKEVESSKATTEKNADTVSLSVVDYPERLQRITGVIIDGKDYPKDILYKIGKACIKGKNMDGTTMLITTKNGEITYQTPQDIENLKADYAQKDKFFSRILMRNDDGSTYYQVRLKRATGGYAMDNIGMNDKVGFVINNKLYNEADFVKTFPKDDASYGNAVGVGLVSKTWPGGDFNVKGYKVIFTIRQIKPEDFFKDSRTGSTKKPSNPVTGKTDTGKAHTINMSAFKPVEKTYSSNSTQANYKSATDKPVEKTYSSNSTQVNYKSATEVYKPANQTYRTATETYKPATRTYSSPTGTYKTPATNVVPRDTSASTNVVKL